MPPMYCRHSTDASADCRSTASYLLVDSWARSDSLPCLTFLFSEKKMAKGPGHLNGLFKAVSIYAFLSQPKESNIFSPTLAFPFSFHLFTLLRFHSEMHTFFMRFRPGGGGGYSPKKHLGVCSPRPKTLTLFMSSLQANLRPKSEIFPTLFMSY